MTNPMLEILTGQPGLLAPKEPLFCRDFGETRRYFTINALTDPREVFPGVTDVIRQSAGDPKFLTWYYSTLAKNAVIMGEILDDDYEVTTADAREYGSFFHGLLPGLVANGMQVDPLALPAEAAKYLTKYNLPRINPLAWATRAHRHLLAFCQWIEDEGIEILAVELPVVLREMVDRAFVETLRAAILAVEPLTKIDVDALAERLPQTRRWFGMASRIDLVCRDKHRRLLIVDVKTGEKSYKGYWAYIYQLNFYRPMLQVNHSGPGELCEQETPLLFNWSPKKTKRPAYHFDEQPDVPFGILAAMADKFWLERGKTFLSEQELALSDKVFAPGRIANAYHQQTYYETIQADCLSMKEEIA